MFYIQFVDGIGDHPEHLLNRIRILTRPAPESGDLTYNWHVSATDEPMIEDEVRGVMAEHGINYPEHIPLIPGDYSISVPEWNAQYYEWNEQPHEWSPLWVQPTWWQFHNWNDLPDYEDQNILLRNWQKLPDDLITQAQAAERFDITIQTINQAIQVGRIKGYKNPDATASRQGATLVSEAEVKKLWHQPN
jgi:hypothetical protein